MSSRKLTGDAQFERTTFTGGARRPVLCLLEQGGAGKRRCEEPGLAGEDRPVELGGVGEGRKEEPCPPPVTRWAVAPGGGPSSWRSWARWPVMLSSRVVSSSTLRWRPARCGSISLLAAARSWSAWALAWASSWPAFLAAVDTSRPAR